MAKARKIGWVEAGLMIGLALIVDLIQAFLTAILIGFILNPLISFFAYLTFWLWFKFKGVSFANPKRAAVGGLTMLIEVLPGFSLLPALSAGVALTVLSTRVKMLGLEKAV